MYEEGRAYYFGSDLKKENMTRDQLMAEASASAEFTMATAYCRSKGWNGLKQDEKKAF